MLHELVKHLSDDQWIEILNESVTRENPLGIPMPRFPTDDVQVKIMGSSGRVALAGADKMYRFMKKVSKDGGCPLSSTSKILDFGCGWGRFTRFFVKDVEDSNILGADVAPAMVQICQSTRVPGEYSLIDPTGKLPYEDGTISHILSYSVFTHLPEVAASHWLAELSRVAAPGAMFVFTVEPPRFLDTIADGDASTTDNWWLKTLIERHKAQAVDGRERLAETGYAFIPTNGEHLADQYGDSVFTSSYIKREWAKYFSLVSYLDEPQQFQQAVVVMKKPV